MCVCACLCVCVRRRRGLAGWAFSFVKTSVLILKYQSSTHTAPASLLRCFISLLSTNLKVVRRGNDLNFGVPIKRTLKIRERSDAISVDSVQQLWTFRHRVLCNTLERFIHLRHSRYGNGSLVVSKWLENVTNVRIFRPLTSVRLDHFVVAVVAPLLLLF